MISNRQTRQPSLGAQSGDIPVQSSFKMWRGECWGPGAVLAVFVLPMFSSSICVASRLRDTETLLAGRENQPSHCSVSSPLLFGACIGQDGSSWGPWPGIKYWDSQTDRANLMLVERRGGAVVNITGSPARQPASPLSVKTNFSSRNFNGPF